MPDIIRLSDAHPMAEARFSCESDIFGRLPDIARFISEWPEISCFPGEISAQMILAAREGRPAGAVILRLRSDDPYAAASAMADARDRLQCDASGRFPLVPGDADLLPDRADAFLRRPHRVLAGTVTFPPIVPDKPVNHSALRARLLGGHRTGIAWEMTPRNGCLAFSACLWGAAAPMLARMLCAQTGLRCTPPPADGALLACAVRYDPWALHTLLGRHCGSAELADAANSITRGELQALFGTKQ